ncbi:MAG: RNA methyltransferase [Spirochaetaceae bacterium]|nr:MAG: RNA methyltransferase [Spirochaetaceae bacterium]
MCNFDHGFGLAAAASPAILAQMSRLTDRTRIVLCNPKTSVNVGACCRAMKTMGVTGLDIVAPAAPLDDREVRITAVHAADVYDAARRFDTLEQSLADAVVVAGTSRRLGTHRAQPRYTPESFAQHAATIGGGGVAIVFGNEEHGLTTDQLRLCPLVITIPCHPGFASLNLSHAVQVVSYALYTSQSAQRERVAITQQQLDVLMETILRTLELLGFFRVFSSRDTQRLFRDVFARAGLSPREAERLQRIFHKIPFMKTKYLDGEPAGE